MHGNTGTVTKICVGKLNPAPKGIEKFFKRIIIIGL
jgi:hypothetical protein